MYVCVCVCVYVCVCDECNKRRISEGLMSCTLFRASKEMRVTEAVEELVRQYENILQSQMEMKTYADDAMNKLAESEEKVKRFAQSIKKLQASREERTVALDAANEKLKVTQVRINEYQKTLNTIQTEIQRSLDRWQAFLSTDT
ncbi:hypothetical protein RFI_33628, partial [Reticulomyxa filosa]